MIKDDIMSISMWNTCMNRSQFLEQSLPSWVNQPVKEIIIIDWSSRESIKPIIDNNQNGKILLVRVNGKQYFNKSKAHNLASRILMLNKPEYFFGIDCDVILNNDIFKHHQLTNSSFYTGPENEETTGTFLVSSESFLKINGFNELMEGWGWEDYDLYNRLKNIGLENKIWNDSFFTNIKHSDIFRTENYEIKDKWQSGMLNKSLSENTVWDASYACEKQDIILYYPNGEIKEFTF